MLFLIFLSFVLVNAQYEVPDATVELLQGRGFKVSIPDEEGIKLFAFHGKINEEFDGLDAGTFAKDILKAKNGSWTFTDKTTKFKVGDVIYYWLYVIYFNGVNELGYQKLDQKYVVREMPENLQVQHMNNRDNSNTVVNNSKVLLFDDFSANTLRQDVWTVEQRFADAPDHEFVMYVNRGETLQMSDNKLKIKPVPSEEIFGQGFVHSTKGYDFEQSCTGIIGSQLCKRRYEAGFILPPVASSQVTTKNKFAFKYGQIEVRAKLPLGDWIYPEIYLNPARETYGPNYKSGQIRIAFAPGNREMNNVLHGGIVLGENVASRSYGDKTVEQRRGLWSDDFHIFTVTWKPTEISFSVDGMAYGNIYPPSNGFAELGPMLNIKTEKWKEGSKMAPFDQEMYVTLGVGVGGFSFADSPFKPWRNGERNSFTKFYSARDKWRQTWTDASKLEVDYVKITGL